MASSRQRLSWLQTALHAWDCMLTLLWHSRPPTNSRTSGRAQLVYHAAKGPTDGASPKWQRNHQQSSPVLEAKPNTGFFANTVIQCLVLLPELVNFVGDSAATLRKPSGPVGRAFGSMVHQLCTSTSSAVCWRPGVP